MLRIHHIRNATMVIESEKNTILIDPMLGEQGSIFPFSLFRYKAKMNPTVSLPSNSTGVLQKVTHCLITHRHPDHIDNAGINFLKERNIPVTCSIKDSKSLTSSGLNVVQELKYYLSQPFLGGNIMGVPARHGYGIISKAMGNVIGYYLELNSYQSIYLSSDTIYTKDVENILEKYNPSICVLACGGAQLDLFNKLMMNEEDILKFVEKANGKVIANHLEALNHCPMTREQLNEILVKNNLAKKVIIPEDGATMEFNL